MAALQRKTFLKRTTIKRIPTRRSWTGAREKIEAEGCCRYCGIDVRLEAAHIIGRAAQDEERIGPKGGATLVVPADAVIPLCDAFFGLGCHDSYDRHEISLEGLLTVSELKNAIRAVGKGRARKRITGGER
jgi:hypothetical protein